MKLDTETAKYVNSDADFLKTTSQEALGSTISTQSDISIKTKTYNIIDQLLSKSVSKTWDEAKKEWRTGLVYYVGRSDDFETCICGHYPIREVHIIVNNNTNEKVLVGNCCINHLGNKTYNKVFNAIKENRLNDKLLEFAFYQGIISKWEYDFGMDIYLKRKLTEKQLMYHNKILDKIINEVIK